MSKAKARLSFQGLFCLLLLSTLFIPFSRGDVGTAAQYGPPYLPTACFGGDASQFPSSNMFGSAGEGIWDNGAACGRLYEVRCVGAATPGACNPGQTIQIKIVDRAQTLASRPSMEGALMVLSSTAFQTITSATTGSINIDFRQV